MLKHLLTLSLIALLATAEAAAADSGAVRMQDLVAAASKSEAGPARIKRGGFCTGYPGDTLRCDPLGNVEVSGIYAKGWRVVSAYQSNGSVHVLFIEEQ